LDAAFGYPVITATALAPVFRIVFRFRLIVESYASFPGRPSAGPFRDQMDQLARGYAMATEIERKFLVDAAIWNPATDGVPYRQGYLSRDKERVVRVRIAGDRAYLGVKGPSNNISRLELEYPIPVADAAVLLDRLCLRPLIEKTRYRQRVGAHVWEVDVFH